MVGLLPDSSGASFADACAGLFSAPEVYRYLLKVPNPSLIEAVNFHAASVSGSLLSSIRSLILFPSGDNFMYRFFYFHRPCSWLVGSNTKGMLFARA
jgi:hypothetical protein